MKLSVFDIPGDQLKRLNDTLINALNRETLFGTGAGFRRPLQHDVLDADWSVTKITQHVFDKARTQLGSSGSGNHFVEFGILTLTDEKKVSGTFSDPKKMSGTFLINASCRRDSILRCFRTAARAVRGRRWLRITRSWRAIFIPSFRRS
jgi:hypothetical protein